MYWCEKITNYNEFIEEIKMRVKVKMSNDKMHLIQLQ